MGPVTQRFEEEFANYLGVKYAFGVANGTAALHIAHKVLGIGPGDEVIAPSLTFVATANSVLYCGAKPVFADVTSLNNFNISPDDILEKITTKTKAITIVHYGGYPCDMDAIMKIANGYNLKVIEDAAHAPGAKYEEKKCGTIGDIGCFSFFANKNLVTGEGGMIVTNDDALAESIRIMRSHGMTTLTWDRHKGHAHSYDVVDIGFNYRINEVASALGLVQLKKLDENNEKRRKIVEEYRKRLENISRSLGASLTETFVRVTFRLAWRSMLVGIIMCSARAISEFGAVVIVAYHPMIAPVMIYERFTAYGIKYSQPVAVWLIVVSLLLFLLLRICSLPKENQT